MSDILKEMRTQALYALAGLAILIVTGMFYGVIWFAQNPDALNVTFIGSAWYPYVLLVTVLIGVGLACSFFLNRKSLLVTRLLASGFCFAVAGMLYFWWYELLPYLYGR